MFQTHTAPQGIQYIYMNQGHWLCALDQRADNVHTECISDIKDLIYVLRVYCFKHKTKYFLQDSSCKYSPKYSPLLQCMFTVSENYTQFLTIMKFPINTYSLIFRLLHIIFKLLFRSHPKTKILNTVGNDS